MAYFRLLFRIVLRERYVWVALALLAGLLTLPTLLSDGVFGGSLFRETVEHNLLIAERNQSSEASQSIPAEVVRANEERCQLLRLAVGADNSKAFYSAVVQVYQRDIDAMRSGRMQGGSVDLPVAHQALAARLADMDDPLNMPVRQIYLRCRCSPLRQPSCQASFFSSQAL